MHIVYAIVHADAHDDRRDGDGHDVQRDTHQAHDAQHQTRRQHIGGQRDQGQRQGAEQGEEHQQDGDEYRAQGEDLGFEQALQDVVVQHQHAGETDALRRDAQLLCQGAAQVLQELVPAQVLAGFHHPHGQPRLLPLPGKVGIHHHRPDIGGQALLHQRQLDAAHILSQQVLDHRKHSGQGQHLAGLGQGVDIGVHRVQFAHALQAEPVAGLERLPGGGEVVHITGELVVPLVLRGGGGRGKIVAVLGEGIVRRHGGRFAGGYRLQARQGLVGIQGGEDDIQGNGAAQLGIQQLHALVDLGGLVEIVDEPVLHLQAADARGCKRHHSRGHRQDGGAVPVHHPGEQTGHGGVGTGVAVRPARWPDQHHAGHHQEIEKQAQGDTGGHHPAEIDDRLYARHHQRYKGHDGGDAGVDAGRGHQPHGAQHPLVQVAIGLQRMQLAVAHDQVDGYRQGHDQQHRHEVGGDHRHPPVQGAQQSQHDHHGRAAGDQGNHHPAHPPEDKGQDKQHDAQDRRTEDHQVTGDKADHVGGDHGHPADEDIGVGAVLVGDLPDVFHQRALGLQHLRRVGLELLLDLGQLPGLGGGEPLVIALDAQAVAQRQQVVVAIVPLQVDLHRGQLAVAAGQQIGVDRAGGQLPQHQLLVYARLVEAGQGIRGSDIRQGDHRAFQQRHVPHRHHRGDAIQQAQFIGHAAQGLQRLVAQQRPGGLPGEQQEILGTVLGADLAIELQRGVALQHQ